MKKSLNYNLQNTVVIEYPSFIVIKTSDISKYPEQIKTDIALHFETEKNKTQENRTSQNCKTDGNTNQL